MCGLEKLGCSLGQLGAWPGAAGVGCDLEQLEVCPGALWREGGPR